MPFGHAQCLFRLYYKLTADAPRVKMRRVSATISKCTIAYASYSHCNVAHSSARTPTHTSKHTRAPKHTRICVSIVAYRSELRL